MPGLPVTLFTDQDFAANSDAAGLFDDVARVQLSGPPLREKLRLFNCSPYQQTLFLDTDTYLLADVSELFDLLDNFDLAATHDHSYQDWFPAEANVPRSFRELNTGVLVYRKSAQTGRFLEDCLVWYDRLASLPGPRFRGEMPNQPAFRAAVFHSALRVAALPAEYNCRFPYFGHASGDIKLLHGREFLSEFCERELEKAGAALNAATTPRVFVAGDVWTLARSNSHFSRRYVPRLTGRLFGSNLFSVIKKTRQHFRKGR
jgi:hypothetical protein